MRGRAPQGGASLCCGLSPQAPLGGSLPCEIPVPRRALPGRRPAHARDPAALPGKQGPVCRVFGGQGRLTPPDL